MKRIFCSLFVILAGGLAYGQFWDVTDPVKLGGNVNSEAEESIPVFSSDSSVLYFVRTYDEGNKGGHYDQDIYSSKQEGTDTYSDGERVGGSLNNKFNNAVVGLAGNGSKMYLLNSYDGKKDQEKGLAVSEKKGSGWSSPSKVEIPTLDIEGDYFGFFVADNESVIIISYAGPNSLGEEDLYVSTNSGGNWSIPTHMGSAINSTGFEISPFLSKNGDTLYFSSNGFGGEGDADIFYSVKQGAWDKWSMPANLGSKINSPMFDAYFSIAGRRCYWSSNRSSELADIWMCDILTPPPLTASCSTTDASSPEGKDGLIMVSPVGGVAPIKYRASADGIDVMNELNGGVEEEVRFGDLQKGSYTVQLRDAVGAEVKLTCVVGAPELVFENFSFKHNFSYNKYKLTTAEGELKELVEKINAQIEEGRESITIQIVSSASQVPTKTFGTNNKLAQTRADNLLKDLTGYFGDNAKVNIEIVDVKVEGPDYDEDSANKDKYAPYQFVSLQTK
jgi:hypothetical protein